MIYPKKILKISILEKTDEDQLFRQWKSSAAPFPFPFPTPSGGFAKRSVRLRDRKENDLEPFLILCRSFLLQKTVEKSKTIKRLWDSLLRENFATTSRTEILESISMFVSDQKHRHFFNKFLGFFSRFDSSTAVCQVSQLNREQPDSSHF